MKNLTVREMMVPLAEYATVSREATLYEALAALENAQNHFDGTRYRHRAILVFDRLGRIVGKLSQMDVIKALEPEYTKKLENADLSRLGFGGSYLESVMKQSDFWSQPLDHLCREAGRQKVATVMYTPTEGEFIAEGASLQDAIHLFMVGHHHSLLVTGGEDRDIVGVLRLSDVFASICEEMRLGFGENENELPDE